MTRTGVLVPSLLLWLDLMAREWVYKLRHLTVDFTEFGPILLQIVLLSICVHSLLCPCEIKIAGVLIFKFGWRRTFISRVLPCKHSFSNMNLLLVRLLAPLDTLTGLLSSLQARGAATRGSNFWHESTLWLHDIWLTLLKLHHCGNLLLLLPMVHNLATRWGHSLLPQPCSLVHSVRSNRVSWLGLLDWGRLVFRLAAIHITVHVVWVQFGVSSWLTIFSGWWGLRGDVIIDSFRLFTISFCHLN